MNTKVNEGKLISGKEALIALANGEEVQASVSGFDWKDSVEFGLVYFLNGDAHFRLKPRTITINGIEVPASFEPKESDIFWTLSTNYVCGYVEILCYRNDEQGNRLIQFGAWRTEEEIKQVVAALRQVLGG